MSTDTAIVLTAAIIVSPGSTAVEDAATRRRQYLEAVRYYADFAPVYFLENSGYDIVNDAEFAGIPGVQLRAIPAQANESRGKGYREFHALDIWFGDETPLPRRVLKITGRYLVRNIAALLEECHDAPDDLLLFDRYRGDGLALTGVFSASADGYARHIRGLYPQVDDPAGAWIEKLIYNALDQTSAHCHFFRHEPDLRGISGSAGQTLRAGRLKFALRQAARTLNRIFSRDFLYLRGTSLRGIKAFIP